MFMAFPPPGTAGVLPKGRTPQGTIGRGFVADAVRMRKTFGFSQLNVSYSVQLDRAAYLAISERCCGVNFFIRGFDPTVQEAFGLL
jgi:hypothetical protein